MSTLKGYVDPQYLEFIAKLLRQYKERTYKIMQIKQGDVILDAGCGSGNDTIALAKLVGENGKVIGIDCDNSMIIEANKAALTAGVHSIIDHRLADVTSLPFKSDFFNSSRSERLFQHLQHPEKALSEMVRVTKPNGWIVVMDADWSTFSLDTEEYEIEQRLKIFRIRHFLQNGFVGRQLYRLFHQQKLEDISIEICPIFLTDCIIGRQSAVLDEVENKALSAGIITNEELKRWRTSLNTNGLFFGHLNQVIVAARKS
jgi:ubiquinone/menaquinone biosynthesis C-methylase UbiE